MPEPWPARLERLIGEKCLVEWTDAPALIKNLQWDWPNLDELPSTDDNDHRDKIILMAKERVDTDGHEVKKSQRSSTKARPPTNRSNPDLDLTGSPLKCSFALDENFDDSYEIISAKSEANRAPTYVPLPSHLARWILSKISAVSSSPDDAWRGAPTFWVHCNGEDDIIYLGLRRLTNHTQTRVVKCYEGFSTKDSPWKMEELFKHHHSIAPTGLKVQTRSTARAVFKLVDDCPTMSADGTGNMLDIEAQWSRAKVFLEKPSPDANIVLNLSLRPGDERMTSNGFWIELSGLLGFAHGLNNEGIIWMERDENTDLEEQIHNFLDSVRQNGPRGQRGARWTRPSNDPSDNDDQSRSADEELEQVLTTSRQDMDFTDQLWLVLMQVESLAELGAALTYIFKTIQQEDLRPFMFPNSSLQTTNVIQELVRDSGHFPDLEGRLPLEILTEIGLEKLQRDYLHTLMSSYLATRDDLEPFIRGNAVREEKLQNLFALHLVLEFVVLLQTYLSPSHECLRSLVQKCLLDLKTRHFDLGPEDPCRYESNFALPSNFVKEQLSKLRPSLWQCSFDSEGEILSARTSALFTVDPPKEYRSIRELKSPQPNETTDDLKYYCCQSTSITRYLESS